MLPLTAALELDSQSTDADSTPQIGTQHDVGGCGPRDSAATNKPRHLGTSAGHTAQRTTVVGSAAADGKVTLEEGARAGFKSRLLVRRPKESSKFNGTVIVEWLNVSGGVDADPGC